MTGAVHALIGAALGSLCNKKSTAFVAGVASHVVADALPHNDFKPSIEIPMLLGTLALTAKLRGIDSNEFWGALGSVAPDLEHGLLLAGLIEKKHRVFPTHISDGKFHGPKASEPWSQIAIAAASILTVLLNDSTATSEADIDTEEPPFELAATG